MALDLEAWGIYDVQERKETREENDNSVPCVAMLFVHSLWEVMLYFDEAIYNSLDHVYCVNQTRTVTTTPTSACHAFLPACVSVAAVGHKPALIVHVPRFEITAQG